MVVCAMMVAVRTVRCLPRLQVQSVAVRPLLNDVSAAAAVPVPFRAQIRSPIPTTRPDFENSNTFEFAARETGFAQI